MNKSPGTVNTTLDLKHKEQLKMFQEERRTLADAQKEIDALKKELDALFEKREQKTLGLAGYQRIQELEILIVKRTDQLTQIQDNQKEYRYLLKTGGLVHQYHECKKQQRRSASQSKESKPSSDRTSLLKLFSIPQQTLYDDESLASSTTTTPTTPSSTTPSSTTPSSTTPSSTTPSSISLPTPLPTPSKVFDYSQLGRADCNKLYLAQIDSNYLPEDDTDTFDPQYCYKCSQYKDLDRVEAKLVCLSCGAYENETLDSDKPNYSREQSQDISNFAYKRINHFNEILNQCQATENTDIPQEVYDAIILEMHKERCYNLAELDYNRTKRYLKKYKDRKYNKFYEHIPHIINRLNGIPPPKFSQIQEENLRNLFKQIQPAYDKHRPKGRSNFLSYYYTIYKLCELLGYDEFLSHLPLLKSPSKLRDQEEVWKNICREMHYQFIPTR